MSLVISDDGITSTRLRYVEIKADGSYQYRRRIPTALRTFYNGKSFFVKSLGRNKNEIAQQCYTISGQLETEWQQSGWKTLHNQTRFQPISTDPQSMNFGSANAMPQIKASQACKLYISLSSSARNKKFVADVEREVLRLITLCGDLPINAYRRNHAEVFRDSQLKSSQTASIRRRLTTIVAIFNTTIKEKQIEMKNPFEGLGIVGEGEDGTKRVPFTSDELKIASIACHNLDDDIRHIVAFLLDTGCRVSEVVGLRIEDVILDGPIPHVRIRPFGKVRTLKTPASERDIPLVGDALWAAERALESRRKAPGASSWLFPRYASDQEIKATHASATMNKWLRTLEGLSDRKTCHCARHAMRDRLRAAQVPLEIQDCLGGWGSRSIGQGYGIGYPLSVLAEHMKKTVDDQSEHSNR